MYQLYIELYALGCESVIYGTETINFESNKSPKVMEAAYKRASKKMGFGFHAASGQEHWCPNEFDTYLTHARLQKLKAFHDKCGPDNKLNLDLSKEVWLQPSLKWKLIKWMIKTELPDFEVRPSQAIQCFKFITDGEQD